MSNDEHWSTRRVVRGGTSLYCRDHGGAGTPVVLLHGLAGHCGEWDGTARWLSARGHRVVSVDQRGHGRSTRRPGDMSRAAHVADVVGFLDELGVESAVVVGQSLGGHTAMPTAAAHPGRVAGLVTVEAGAGGPHAALAAFLDEHLPHGAHAASVTGGP